MSTLVGTIQGVSVHVDLQVIIVEFILHLCLYSTVQDRNTLLLRSLSTVKRCSIPQFIHLSIIINTTFYFMCIKPDNRLFLSIPQL